MQWFGFVSQNGGVAIIFSISVIANLLLKTNGGEGGRDRTPNFVGGAGRLGQKALFL